MPIFYFLSKFLPTLVYPTGLAFVLLVLALILRDRPKVRTGLITVALVALWLGGHKLTSLTLVRVLEGRYPAMAPDEVPEAEAIVVLGGGTLEKGVPRPTHEVSEAGDRVIYAARLYRAGVAPLVIVSGSHGPFHPFGSEPGSAVMAELLTLCGVPKEAILQETVSVNTYENAAETVKMLQAQGIDRIVLVTSAMHMPRSMALFAKYDLAVTAAPTDFLATDGEIAYYAQPDLGVQLVHFLPDAGSLEKTSMAIKELIGIAVYRLRGWL